MLPSQSFLLWLFDVSSCKIWVLLVSSTSHRSLMHHSNVWNARDFPPPMLLLEFAYLLLVKFWGLFSHYSSLALLLVTSYYGRLYCCFRSATHISAERDNVKKLIN